MTTNFFSPLSFVAVFGSGIRDPGSGMGKKVRIRDKHSGSATLILTSLGSAADPHHFDADPDLDPACHLDPDPDPACHFDPGPNKPAQNLEKVLKKAHIRYILACHL